MVMVQPDLLRGMGHGRTPQKPNSRVTLQGLDQRSKMAVELKNTPKRLRYGTVEAEVNQILHFLTAGAAKMNSSILSYIRKKTKEGGECSSEGWILS